MLLFQVDTETERFQIRREAHLKEIGTIEQEFAPKPKWDSEIRYSHLPNLTVNREVYKVWTHYILSSQCIPDERSVIRPIAHFQQAEQALQHLGRLVAASPKFYIPRLLKPTYLKTSAQPRYVMKFSPSNSKSRTEYRGIGFSSVSKIRSWTIRRGKLVRITSYKLQDQYREVLPTKVRTLEDNIRFILDSHSEEYDQFQADLKVELEKELAKLIF